MVQQTYLTLPGGGKLPALGLGTWQSTNEKELEVAVDTALDLGYRHIDTAFAYGNEHVIGRVLNKRFSSGELKREDIFLTTKLPISGVHPDRVELFIKKSLDNLQLDYVDLYLIHFPAGIKHVEGTPVLAKGQGIEMEGPTDFAALWQKMEEQVKAGRAKHIGLSNFNVSQISEILKTATIKPANLQVEIHAHLQQKELIDFCRKNGITVVAYCPLANPSFNAFLQGLGQKPRELPNLLANPVVAKLAEKHSKTPAQIVLRFLLQYGVSAIPKSVSANRVKENFDVFDFALSEDDMDALFGLEIGESVRLCDWKVFPGIEKHPSYPFPK